jgi:hypothetical protein
MFDKCIPCSKIGESCVPNLWLLPFPELVKWCIKRQKYLGWTNQTLADKCNTPVGTISRIWGGDYADCKFSTIKSILITLIGGTTNEFECTALVEKELRQMEQFEQQAAKLSIVEAENENLKAKLNEIDEIHRKDIRVIREEYKEQIDFLKEQLKAWQTRHQ